MDLGHNKWNQLGALETSLGLIALIRKMLLHGLEIPLDNCESSYLPQGQIWSHTTTMCPCQVMWETGIETPGPQKEPRSPTEESEHMKTPNCH